jgi:hypothetical protein
MRHAAKESSIRIVQWRITPFEYVSKDKDRMAGDGEILSPASRHPAANAPMFSDLAKHQRNVCFPFARTIRTYRAISGVGCSFGSKYMGPACFCLFRAALLLCVSVCRLQFMHSQARRQSNTVDCCTDRSVCWHLAVFARRSTVGAF